jgi:AcrR family transcriptional regulator
VSAPPLLTSHGLALLCIAREPGVGIAEVAVAVEDTEPAAEPIVDDLIAAGYVRRSVEGGAETFTVSADLRASVSAGGDVALGALLSSVFAAGDSVHATRRHQVMARLLLAVEELFDEGETFGELTVERLISEAGLSRSTFYSYVGDKSELLQALAADVIEELLDSAADWWERDAPASKAELSDALRRMISTYMRHRVIIGALGDMAASDAGVRQQFLALMGRSAARIARHIANGQKAGFVSRELDPVATATWLNWTTERGLSMLVAPAAGPERERMHTAMTDMYWNLLYEGAG